MAILAWSPANSARTPPVIARVGQRNLEEEGRDTGILREDEKDFHTVMKQLAKTCQCARTKLATNEPSNQAL